MKTRWLLLLGSLPLLVGCPEKTAPDEAARSAAAARPTGKPASPEGPDDEARARAERLRDLRPKTTTELRASWALAACAEGCDPTQERAATRLAAAAQLVPYSRDDVPVGLQLVQLRAYSPWIACRLEPGDRVTAVEKRPVRKAEDVPTVIRACALGQALTVERRGELVELPPRGEAASGKAAPAPEAAPEEALPPGTRDLE